MKTLLAILAIFMAATSLHAGRDADQNLVEWCIHRELAEWQRMPSFISLAGAYHKAQDEGRTADADKLYEQLSRLYTLRVQAGYNEAFRRIQERNQQMSVEALNMRLNESRHFARQLAQELHFRRP